MAFQGITNLSLGDILQIYYSDGIRNQISQDYRDWEHIKREKVADPKGRQINFYFQNSNGPSAIQRRNPGAFTNFPSAQRVSASEHTAQIKEIAATIELEHNLWERAEMSKDVRYSEPLKIEMDAKLISLKRQLSLELHLDGTGVLGELGDNSDPLDAVIATVLGNGDLQLELSSANGARGHVGAFQYDEILILRAANGGASVLDTDLVTEPVYFKVIDRDFDNDRIVVRGLDVAGAELVIASVTVQPAAGEVLYKYEQPTIPDLTAVADYGTASEAMPGLESLSAGDGRVVHGITMSGSTAGSRFDAGATQLDTTHLEAVMNKVKINVGQSAYAFKMGMLAPQAYSQFINDREGDRRFNSVEDSTRGTRKWTYQHREDSIELYGSEFAKKKRFYMMPEARQGQGKVMEYHGTDFSTVKAPGGQDFHMKSSSLGGYENTVVSYLKGYGTLICKHPAAMAVIENFTLA